MLDPKRTHSRKGRKRQFTRFPEVKGKIVESVEVDPDIQAVVILFKDRTALSFDLDPCLTVFSELSLENRQLEGISAGQPYTAEYPWSNGLKNQSRAHLTDAYRFYPWHASWQLT